MLVRDNLHPLITASIMTEVRQLVEKHMVDLKLFLERPEPASETTEEGESSL